MERMLAQAALSGTSYSRVNCAGYGRARRINLAARVHGDFPGDYCLGTLVESTLGKPWLDVMAY